MCRRWEGGCAADVIVVSSRPAVRVVAATAAEAVVRDAIAAAASIMAIIMAVIVVVVGIIALIIVAPETIEAAAPCPVMPIASAAGGQGRRRLPCNAAGRNSGTASSS